MDFQRTWDVIRQRKRPRESAVRIGDVLRSWGGPPGSSSLERLAKARAAVEQVMDHDYRRHCRAVRLIGGLLTVQLDDPGLAYHFRRHYLFELREHLARTLPQVGVTDIRFEGSSA